MEKIRTITKETNDQPTMKTIIFYIVDRENGISAVRGLCDDIQAREDAKHKLYFKFLMNGTYMISMGCKDTDGIKHFVGNHEIIFIPANRQQDIERLKETKNVVWYKNCMIMAGEGEHPTRLRSILIDWLLEKMEDINQDS